MTALFSPPIFDDRVLEDPSLVRRLVERTAPHLPVQRYFANDAEYRASSASKDKKPMIVAPNFRGDWAYDRPLVEGVEPLFAHPGFVRNAEKLFGTDRIRPFCVFANITWQLPFNQGDGHIDIPEFRGFDRTRYPTWLLSMMSHSRLFEDERIQIATAVAWFYEGQDGGFQYWPDGPDAPPRIHEGRIFNTAVTGDNEKMFHRVRPVGRRSDGFLMGMTLDTRLEHRGGDDWAIVEQDEELATLDYGQLRISVSWKARAFRSAEEEQRYTDHSADLGLDEVLARFYADLEARGVAFDRPADPLADPAFTDLLSSVYLVTPTVFESATGR
jgi:hypothetical protein